MDIHFPCHEELSNGSRVVSVELEFDQNEIDFVVNCYFDHLRKAELNNEPITNVEQWCLERWIKTWLQNAFAILSNEAEHD
jgi:hypothetical protein